VTLLVDSLAEETVLSYMTFRGNLSFNLCHCSLVWILEIEKFPSEKILVIKSYLLLFVNDVCCETGLKYPDKAQHTKSSVEGFASTAQVIFFWGLIISFVLSRVCCM